MVQFSFLGGLALLRTAAFVADGKAPSKREVAGPLPPPKWVAGLRGHAGPAATWSQGP